ncbi:zeta toxin family protein [Croceicoccus mobilis]|uniref:Zeta toxin domain-containing protein n=1 Tax=Croceicoccus mobilis TaxID=1703339 RepID=A0A917DWN4_9SPHN|nr:zeta toxin family protein [Croceicoccus mobilis]GGD74771.1 hypothetical protein GCM10010990_25550 [Croceicoccus mobilis]
MTHPTLAIIAGPNGSGKSTLYRTRIAARFAGPFINADIIQRDELCDPSVKAAYKAAAVASKRRSEYLVSRQSFVTETVFSHPSKLDIITDAKAAGFQTYVFHVAVESPDLSVARVQARVEEGGHPVPEDKIRERYERSADFIRQAICAVDYGFVYDNSKWNSAPEPHLYFVGGQLSRILSSPAEWIQQIYGDLIKG